jgi:benzoyl-CoA reductase subunit A
MGFYLGIDLGSTTTKAVLMDEREQIIGRGITNTRSNYGVATQVAGDEAMNSARFFLLRHSVSTKGNLPSNSENFFSILETNFKYLQQMEKLRYLKENCLELANSSKFGPRRTAIRDVLLAIFNAIEDCSYDLFSSGSLERSQFFRDIVGSEYLRLADTHGRTHEVRFEELMGIYDKSIIKVENRVPECDYKRYIRKALELTLQQQPDLVEENLVKRVKEMIECQDNSSGEPLVQAHGVEILLDSLPVENTVGTGYGRQRLPFRKDQIRSEILCHGLGAHFLFPGTRTVLDIGGQDTKAIQVDEHGIVKSFQMNDRCAAGCGRYLGYIADELNIGLHELGPLSLQATRTVRINSTCTVFAGAELRDRLSLGESRENILAGLHRAIVLRAMSLLARSGGVFNEFTFTGGVAKNSAVVKSLKELVSEHYNVKKVNVHSDSIYTGAIGAALFALRG